MNDIMSRLPFQIIGVEACVLVFVILLWIQARTRWRQFEDRYKNLLNIQSFVPKSSEPAKPTVARAMARPFKVGDLVEHRVSKMQGVITAIDSPGLGRPPVHLTTGLSNADMFTAQFVELKRVGRSPRRRGVARAIRLTERDAASQS